MLIPHLTPLCLDNTEIFGDLTSDTIVTIYTEVCANQTFDINVTWHYDTIVIYITENYADPTSDTIVTLTLESYVVPTSDTIVT